LYSGGAAGGYYANDPSGNWETVTSNMVIYEILPGADPAVTMTIEIPVVGYITATPTIYPPPDDPSAAVTITTAGYAPWDPGPYPEVQPIPRFIQPPPFAGTPLLEIDPCTTNLLYPYLVSGESWDTGVSVANTGMDPFYCYGPDCGQSFASGAATGPNVYGTSGYYNMQPGVCWFFFYGTLSTAPSTPLPPAQPVVLGWNGFTQGSNTAVLGDDPQDYIQPGQTGQALISVALMELYPSWVPTKSMWNGYAIAICDFLYAHGYAFSDFHGTAAQGGNYSLGYLALVFDQRGIYHNSQRPEWMTF
jgi:hypothetical protein